MAEPYFWVPASSCSPSRGCCGAFVGCAQWSDHGAKNHAIGGGPQYTLYGSVTLNSSSLDSLANRLRSVETSHAAESYLRFDNYLVLAT